MGRKVLNSLAKVGMREMIRIGCFRLDKLARFKVALGRKSEERNFYSEWKVDSFESTPTGASCEGVGKSRTPAQRQE